METKPKSKAVHYGIMAGVFGLILGFLNYMLGTSMMGNWVMATVWGLGTLIVSMGVYITLMAMAAKYFRKQQGFLTFGQGFKEAYIVPIIAGVLGLLLNLVLLNVIDPGYGDRMKEATMEFTSEMMEKQGVPDATIEKQMDKMAKRDQYGIKSQFIQTIIYFIIMAIIAAIVAAIVKRKEEIIIDHG